MACSGSQSSLWWTRTQIPWPRTRVLCSRHIEQLGPLKGQWCHISHSMCQAWMSSTVPQERSNTGQATPKRASPTHMLNIPVPQWEQTETKVPKCLKPTHLITWLELHKSKKSWDWDNGSAEICKSDMYLMSGSLSALSLTYWPSVREITSPLWFSVFPSAKQEDNLNQSLGTTGLKCNIGFIPSIGYHLLMTPCNWGNC